MQILKIKRNDHGDIALQIIVGNTKGIIVIYSFGVVVHVVDRIDKQLPKKQLIMLQQSICHEIGYGKFNDTILMEADKLISYILSFH